MNTVQNKNMPVPHVTFRQIGPKFWQCSGYGKIVGGTSASNAYNKWKEAIEKPKRRI